KGSAALEQGETMVAMPEDREKTNPRKRYRIVNKSAGYLLRIRRVPRYGGNEYICNDESSPCPALVILYARLGLHRYNLLQGKNLELSSVKKYNKSSHSAASSYHITLDAIALQPFETTVYEISYGKLALTCRIARPLGETTIDEIKRCSSSLYKNFSPIDTMPEWPPENPFEHSKLLNSYELQDNDWIRLYLELAVATTNRGTIMDHDLSNLMIVQVAIDTTPQDVDLVFNRTNFAIVYIRYKDSCEARVGKDVDRVAIVRRAFDEQLGCFSLVGKTLSLPKECIIHINYPATNVKDEISIT
ncbi:Protein MS5, partial [Arabidopsis suecica]